MKIGFKRPLFIAIENTDFMHPQDISIADYTYILPDDKIAEKPLQQRDESKLLVVKNGKIFDDAYVNISTHLPQKSLLIFNNTKVIQARILFQKSSGGIIEIFCLEPYETIKDYSYVMNKKETVRWKCLIGGASKWKEDELKLKVDGYELRIKCIEKLTNAYVVEFNWEGNATFAEILEKVGDIPLPPYIKRKPEAEDKERYQTVYAKYDGSVAAPTAGLHFTDKIFTSLTKKNIVTNYVTLHVGAGTFKPVKAPIMQQHEMHAEWIDVHIDTIKNIIENLQNVIVAVGTTSARTLESLYWLGIKAKKNPVATNLHISQWEVYDDLVGDISTTEALQYLLDWLKSKKLNRLFTSTQILIAPGYQFKVIKALVTNFHQPNSTLLLLVAAVLEQSNTVVDWKKIYNHALQNEYRFLSYGDGCLLLM